MVASIEPGNLLQPPSVARIKTPFSKAIPVVPVGKAERKHGQKTGQKTMRSNRGPASRSSVSDGLVVHSNCISSRTCMVVLRFCMAAFLSGGLERGV